MMMGNKRTIFWTLMTDTRGQRETHRSNWVWYADGLKTKQEWKKTDGKLWESKRVPLFKKGLYGTISLGEIVKAFGTPEDKKQWKRTLKSIGALGLSSGFEEPRAGDISFDLEPSQPQSITASSEETNQ